MFDCMKSQLFEKAGHQRQGENGGNFDAPRFLDERFEDGPSRSTRRDFR
jgi:hypothetical protein